MCFLILFLHFISFQHRRKLAASKLCQVGHRSCSVGTTFSCDAVSRRLVILVPELFVGRLPVDVDPEIRKEEDDQRKEVEATLTSAKCLDDVGWISSDSRLSLTLWFFYAPWLSTCVECTHSLFSRFSCFVSWLCWPGCVSRNLSRTKPSWVNVQAQKQAAREEEERPTLILSSHKWPSAVAIFPKLPQLNAWYQWENMGKTISDLERTWVHTPCISTFCFEMLAVSHSHQRKSSRQAAGNWDQAQGP